MIFIALYLGAIVSANLLTATYGPGISVFNAFAFIGLDLTARDNLHDAWSGKHLTRNMALLIISGSVISWILNRNAGQIAIASFVAFAFAAIIDTIAYHRMKHRGWKYLKRVNGSNVFSALVDSMVFPSVAFGFPLQYGVMVGQFLSKIFGGFLWSIAIFRIRGSKKDTSFSNREQKMEMWR